MNNISQAVRIRISTPKKTREIMATIFSKNRQKERELLNMQCRVYKVYASQEERDIDRTIRSLDAIMLK